MLFEPALSLTHSLVLGMRQVEAEEMWLVVSWTSIPQQDECFVMSGKCVIFCAVKPDKQF
jgi:hypothetical protein